MSITHLHLRSTLLIVSVAGAALLTRLFLFLNPGAGGSTVLGVHVHHLLIGILLVGIGGVPAVLLRSEGFLKSFAVVVFGVGLGLALDEWVLFVVRETTPDASYMTTPSLVGALSFVVLVAGYAVVIDWFVAWQEDRVEIKTVVGDID